MASLRSKLFRRYLRFMQARTDRSASVGQQRQAMENTARMMRPPRGVAVQSLEVCGRYAEWLTPAGAPPDRAILYLHGGGYTLCSANTHRAMVARIAQASSTRALLLEYRLAPEHPFPAAVEDAINAWGWLGEHGYVPQRALVIGDSAGGGLALALLLSLRDRGAPLPAAAVLLSPFTDLTASGESVETRRTLDPMNKIEDAALMAHYIGQNDPANPLLSPLFADLHGLPPLLIHVGDHEIMLSDSTRLCEKAQAAGVNVALEVWPEMWHVFHFFAPWMPEANRAIAGLGRYVQQRLAA